MASSKAGYSVIIRDSDGFIVGEGGEFKDEDMLAKWVKLYAFEESLKIAWSLNITKAIFENGCASLVNKVKKRRKDITIMGYRIDEAFKNVDFFNSITVIWVNRSYNKALGRAVASYTISNIGHPVVGAHWALQCVGASDSIGTLVPWDVKGTSHGNECLSVSVPLPLFRFSVVLQQAIAVVLRQAFLAGLW
ncbi:hypothetical protein PVK06_008298 [Gossypium arboreum]|uniref:RNase H type-1 domain-containing protein n=1 Tax=Gossypium arboreum TaxID=29729 RepID=A0ABR0QJL6_GOSAR|nr:hypothetical protein PVK06_008298 [Gossypium arboreum]